jgi:multidrug resistance efflux pump
MGEMTKDEVNVGLFEECKRLQARVDELEAELAKHQGSTFHPDWSLLEATRDTVEELKRELKIANTFAVSRRKTIADLQAKVKELEGSKDDPWTYWRRRSAQLEAKLKAEEDKATVRHQASQKAIEQLQAKVKKLTAELKTEITYHAGTDTHYRAARMRAALKQEVNDV